MQLNINTPGCYLSVKDQLFTIRSPADEKGENYRFKHIPPQKISSIIFNATGSLSTAAITLPDRRTVFSTSDFESSPQVWLRNLFISARP